MIRLTSEQFEELKRIHNPEIFTEAQMGAWVEGLKDTLVKAEVDELDEQEKAVVDEFNHEFTSFVKVEVISRPSESELSKGLKYDNFFIRDKQVEWSGEDIIKSTDGVEEVISRRTGIYLDTKLNREMNRVGLVFGEKESVGDEGAVNKSKEDDIEKGGEGSKGGKIIGHTKSGHPIYDHSDHPHLHSNGFQGGTAKLDIIEHHYKHFSPADHREAAQKLHDSKSGDKSVKSRERKTKLIDGHLTEAYIKENGHPKDVPGQKNPMHEDVRNRTEAMKK